MTDTPQEENRQDPVGKPGNGNDSQRKSEEETVSSVTRMSPGNWRSSSGSARLIASTVPITLAPGWRRTSTMIAGVAFIQAPRRVFSADITTSATSAKRTGAPSTKAITRLR